MKRRHVTADIVKKEAKRIENLYAGFLKEIAVLRNRQNAIIKKYTKALEDRKMANVRKQLGLR